MPKVLSQRHVLAVNDLERCTAYFLDSLGFTRDFSVEGWELLSLGDFKVMLGECPDEVPASDTNNHSYFAHVIVDAVDPLSAEMTARGAIVLQPVRDKPWGLREFAVATPEGHRIMFAQEIE